MQENSRHGNHSNSPQDTDENCSDNVWGQTVSAVAKSSSFKGHFQPFGDGPRQQPVPQDDMVKSSRPAQTGEPFASHPVTAQGSISSQQGIMYQTSTIDATLPGHQAIDCEASCPAHNLYEGVNVSLSFDPNPSRQDLPHAIADVQSESVPISEKDQHGKVAIESSQASFGRCSSGMEPSIVKSASGSMQNVDKVSVHSQKLDTVSGALNSELTLR